MNDELVTKKLGIPYTTNTRESTMEQFNSSFTTWISRYTASKTNNSTNTIEDKDSKKADKVEVGVSPTVNPKDDSTKLNPEKQINIDPNVVSTRNRLFSKISKREYISSGEIYVLNEDGTLKDVGYYEGSRFISSNQEILNLRKKSQDYKDIKKLYDKDLYEYKVFNSTLVHDLKYLIDKVGPEYLENEIRRLKAIALGT